MKKLIIILIIFLIPSFTSAAILGNNVLQNIFDAFFGKTLNESKTPPINNRPVQPEEENKSRILEDLTPSNDVIAGTPPTAPKYNSKIDEFFQRDNSKAVLSKSQVQDAQRKLGVSADGKIGPKTTEAIEKSLSQGKNLASLKQENKDTRQSAVDCKKPTVKGDEKNIIGCGTASNFGVKPNGSKDTYDDGNLLCNHLRKNQGLPPIYTYSNGKGNLNAMVAALRISDIRNIFKIPSSIDIKSLAAQKKFCGRWIKVKNSENGKTVDVQLMDIMNSDVERAIDLAGGPLLILGIDPKKPINPRVELTWTEQPQLNQQVANIK